MTYDEENMRMTQPVANKFTSKKEMPKPVSITSAQDTSPRRSEDL